MSPEFSTFAARLKRAKTCAELDRLEQAATRLYNAECLTVSEFRRIDVAIMERLAAL